MGGDTFTSADLLTNWFSGQVREKRLDYKFFFFFKLPKQLLFRKFSILKFSLTSTAVQGADTVAADYSMLSLSLRSDIKREKIL